MRHANKKLFFGFVLGLLSLLLPSISLAQAVITGQETTVIYTGANATLANPNTPVLNFSSPNGTNTFILPLTQSGVSIRVYITNNTANACAGSLSLTLWAASDPQVTSFNNSPANWQVVPLQNPLGSLATTLNVSVPSSGVTYVSSTTIASSKAVVQLVNTNGGCNTTNVEVTVNITPVAVTSPLVSAASSSSVGFGGTASNVQGVVAAQTSGSNVFPVITGGLQTPVNGNFLTVGLDNVSGGGVQIPGLVAGTFISGIVPALQQPVETAVAFVDCTPANSGGIVETAGWTIFASGCGASLVPRSFTNVTAGQNYGQTYTSTVGGQSIAVIATFPATTTVTAASTSASIGSVAVGEATMVAVECDNVPCNLATVTGTLGKPYAFVGSFQRAKVGAGGASGITVWMVTSPHTSSGTETITATPAAGTTVNHTAMVRLAGFTTTQPTQLSIGNAADTIGRQIVAADAAPGNQFNCSVTLSTNTTTICQAAPTSINGIPVRLYVTDFQINTTTAGTATTLTLVQGTGANCVTGTSNLSAITYANTTVGLQNLLGQHTPLVSNLQSEVCVTQAGTTPGTSVVEIRGYLAP